MSFARQFGFAIMKEKLIYALYWADVLINYYNLCKEFPIIFIFLYLFKLWLFVLGKPGLNFCSFCQKMVKIEDFPEPDVCPLRKVDICRFENETQKRYVTSIQNSICIGYKKPERKTHRHFTSSILSQVLGTYMQFLLMYKKQWKIPMSLVSYNYIISDF